MAQILALAIAAMSLAATITAAPAAPLAKGTWYKACDGKPCVTGIGSPDNETAYLIRVDPAVRQPILGTARVSANVDQKAGMTWQIDGGKKLNVPYIECTAKRCLAQVQLNESYLNALKKGTVYHLGMTVDGQQTVVDIPLKGFAAAVDGPATAAVDDVVKLVGTKR